MCTFKLVLYIPYFNLPLFKYACIFLKLYTLFYFFAKSLYLFKYLYVILCLFKFLLHYMELQVIIVVGYLFAAFISMCYYYVFKKFFMLTILILRIKRAVEINILSVDFAYFVLKLFPFFLFTLSNPNFFRTDIVLLRFYLTIRVLLKNYDNFNS